MAQRKKKRSRAQQKKEQRRAAMAQVRDQRGWKPPQARIDHSREELLEDMLPLFPMLQDVTTSRAGAMEQLMKSVLASEGLIEEPEFEDIIVDPMRCVDTFVKVGEELGIDPEALSQLPDEEREDTQMEMLEMTARQLLTDDLRQDILGALNRLRLRLKGAGKRKQVARVAALQSFLSESDSSEMWPMFGLVQAIVQRSLAAGFDLLEMSREAMEASGPDEIESSLTLSEKLAQSGVVQKADRLLQKIPGLSGFLRKQADTIWEEGVDAIFTGDLYLGIFSTEELEAGLDIFNQTLGGNIIEGAELQDNIPLQIPEEKVRDLVLRLDDYIADLFTPERLDQFRRRLRSIVNSPDYPEKWLAFRLMLLEYMADEDVVENEKRFFISALLGEMRVAGAAMRQV